MLSNHAIDPVCPRVESANREIKWAFVSGASSGGLLLVAIFGHETRGRDLRELETGGQMPAGVQDSVGAD